MKRTILSVGLMLSIVIGGNLLCQERASRYLTFEKSGVSIPIDSLAKGGWYKIRYMNVPRCEIESSAFNAFLRKNVYPVLEYNGFDDMDVLSVKLRRDSCDSEAINILVTVFICEDEAIREGAARLVVLYGKPKIYDDGKIRMFVEDEYGLEGINTLEDSVRVEYILATGPGDNQVDLLYLLKGDSVKELDFKTYESDWKKP